MHNNDSKSRKYDWSYSSIRKNGILKRVYGKSPIKA